MSIDLKAGKVIATIQRLDLRIRERFPDATLDRTAERLLATKWRASSARAMRRKES